jgi:putative phage-type endonuclease
MIYHDVQQNTDEWLNLRKGKFTASAANDLFLKPDTATYRKCIAKVVYERKTGVLLPEEKFTSKAIENGHEREQMARDQYIDETFTLVKNGGFCEMNEWIGCSPDGLVDENGLLQIKCPDFSTIVEYKQTGKLPLNYNRQMQFELMVTEREWNDFYVFYPLITPFTIRVPRDESLIKEIQDKVNEAIETVTKLLQII